jgi:hypothetical protein
MITYLYKTAGIIQARLVTSRTNHGVEVRGLVEWAVVERVIFLRAASFIASPIPFDSLNIIILSYY